MYQKISAAANYLVNLLLTTETIFRYERMMNEIREWENQKKVKAKHRLDRKEVYDYFCCNFLLFILFLFEDISTPNNKDL